ncbi:conserved hypothetical protein [uncultured spirochete]|jgi:hypothetical protein|uniref:Lipocalin-like domain-containing protein n=1 Tax=uncultured spirochete TaxID=156406 RepID=A0A3P3XMY6_9SPIR|nr:conserved hypothetical protein [uncultured spirochete]
MKRFVLFGFLAVLLVAGCELFPNITWEDIKGEWDFPDTTFNDSTIKSIHLSLMDPGEGESEYRIDLSWENGDNYLLHYGEGSMDKNVFSGTYNLGGDYTDSTTYSVTVTFTLNNDQLKAVFTGTGPLNGLVLEHGTLNAG